MPLFNATFELEMLPWCTSSPSNSHTYILSSSTPPKFNILHLKKAPKGKGKNTSTSTISCGVPAVSFRGCNPSKIGEGFWTFVRFRQNVPRLWLNSIGVVRTPWPHVRPSKMTEITTVATSGYCFFNLSVFLGDGFESIGGRLFFASTCLSNSKLCSLIMYDMASTTWPFLTNPDTIFGVPQDSLSTKNHSIGMPHIFMALPMMYFRGWFSGTGSSLSLPTLASSMASQI